MLPSHQRFVVADPEVCEDFDVPVIVILSDVSFWIENYDDLAHWCQMNSCQIQGMTVNLPNKETLSMFVLRWS